MSIEDIVKEAVENVFFKVDCKKHGRTEAVIVTRDGTYIMCKKCFNDGCKGKMGKVATIAINTSDVKMRVGESK